MPSCIITCPKTNLNNEFNNMYIYQCAFKGKHNKKIKIRKIQYGINLLQDIYLAINHHESN